MRRRDVFMAVVLLLLAVSTAWAQQRQITGRVINDETRQGLAGATVVVRGTSTAAFTDANGNFSLSVPDRRVTLVFSIIGFRTEEVVVEAGQSSVTVNLMTDVLALDELVVTGAATAQSRRILPNAIATLNDVEMDRAPAETIEKSMQGKVAGAVIETNSGAPGGGVQVRLRGVSTINALSRPLYVVDGVVISDVDIPSNQNAVTRAASGSNTSSNQDAVVNRVVDLNPQDIESVEILKGASAAAIYGSKASNGVIVITTKKGRVGAPRFSLNQKVGYFDLAEKFGFRTYETADEVDSVFGAGTAAAMGFSPGQVFDHEELLAGRNDLSNETSLSISGGNESTRYFVSGLWKNDEGIIENTGFEKQSLRLNLDQALGDRFDVTVNSNLMHTVAQRGLTNNDNSGTSFYMVFPFTPNFIDLQRDPATGQFPANPFERSNPLQTAALMENEEKVWRFLGAASLTAQAIDADAHELRFILNGGIDYFIQENDLFFPPELQFEPLDGQPGTSLLSDSKNLNANVFANVVYTYRPAGGLISSATTSAGFQYEDRDLEIARVTSRALIAGRPQIDAGTTFGLVETRERTKDEGLYLQEEVLLLDERMLLTAGFRADRSSNNGDPEKFFFYPKAAASYRFDDIGDVLSEVKLRGAWGQSGNLPLFGNKFTPLTGTGNIAGLPGLVVDGATGDPELQPERQNEVEAGIDATLFDGRAFLEATVYQKNITDLLLQRTLAPSTGFTIEFFNGGELRTRGIELGLSATPVQTNAFEWVFRGTFFADRSEILSLPVPSFRTGGFGTALGAFQIEEGESATQIVAVISEGDSSFVAKVGDANPDFTVGLSNDFRIGDFNFYTLFDWRQGFQVINLTRLLYDFGQNSPDFDEDPQFVENIGPVPINAELTRGQRRLAGFGVETRPYVEDGDFIKLREASIGYNVPASALRSLFGEGVRTLRITLTGRNLLTITDYTGLDPEVSNFGNQPIARNIDVAPFPPSRSFWLGVDLTF